MAQYRPWNDVQQHFRDYYTTAPYYQPGLDWDYYAPAYRFGWETALARREQGYSWKQVESFLAHMWNEVSRDHPEWERIRPAVKDAWERAHGTWGWQNETLERFVWNHRRHPVLRFRAEK